MEAYAGRSIENPEWFDRVSIEGSIGSTRIQVDVVVFFKSYGILNHPLGKIFRDGKWGQLFQWGLARHKIGLGIPGSYKPRVEMTNQDLGSRR